MRKLLFYFLSLLIASTAWGEELTLGWQVPWATQGQVVQTLKRTNSLALVGQPVRFVGFAYGAPLNAAALAGQIDVLLTADQPALVLIDRNPGFRVIARLMYNRACVYVPIASSIATLADMRGKSLFGPTGAAAERIALAAVESAGVDVSTLRLGQLDMGPQAALLRKSGKGANWPGVDALYGFDPFPAAFERDGYARMLNCGQIVSVIVASPTALKERKPELRRFLAGISLAWMYYAKNRPTANAWFVQEAGLEVNDNVLDQAAAVEPNAAANGLRQLRLNFSAKDLDDLRGTVRFLRARGLITQPLEPAQFIEPSLLGGLNEEFQLEQLGARLAVVP